MIASNYDLMIYSGSNYDLIMIYDSFEFNYSIQINRTLNLGFNFMNQFYELSNLFYVYDLLK